MPPDKSVSEGKYQEWRLASLSFLQTVLGASNHYCEFFKGEIVPSPDGSKDYSIEEGLGILRAVKGEIEFGPLPRIEGLISGEIFEDFLDMAEHLLEHDYVEVVPSLVGAVLEDALRRIAKAHDIPVKPDSDNISSLNNKLADASVYTNFVRKKVAVWNAMRDNADHGSSTTTNSRMSEVCLRASAIFSEHICASLCWLSGASTIPKTFFHYNSANSFTMPQALGA